MEWIDTLEASPSGRLMLTNVLFAYRTKRPTEKTLRDLLVAVVARWTRDGGRRADSLVESIADELLNTELCGVPRAGTKPCSRVVDALSLVINNINHEELGFGICDEVPPRLLALLEQGIPEGSARGEIRGRRRLAWVTSTEQLEELRREHPDPNEFATVVRDRLGLSHYSQDQLLLEIQYPDDVSGTLQHAAPTFLEGGAGVVFRARECADLWGRAVDLQTMADGLPEAVHRPIAFTSAFRIRRIGRPDRAPGFEFQHVVEGAGHPWKQMPDDFNGFVFGSAGGVIDDA
jgi:hypothetical protein